MCETQAYRASTRPGFRSYQAKMGSPRKLGSLVKAYLPGWIEILDDGPQGPSLDALLDT